MSRRLLAVLVVFGLLLMLPYWWPLLKQTVHVISSEVTGIAQSSPYQETGRGYGIEVKSPQAYSRTYTFEARYSDQQGNHFYIDGNNPDYVYVNGRVSNSLWARIEAFLRRIFSGASLRVEFRPSG